MDLHKTYSSKSYNEINSILKSHESLTIEAKLTLKKVIDEKSNSEDFEQTDIEALSNSINEDLKKIQNLDYLHWIGINLFTENENLIIKKSKSAKSRDSWSIFLGIFLGLFFFFSTYFWADIVKNGFEISKFITSAILTSIGILGFVLLVKTFNRIMDYKGFMLLKNKDGLLLNYRPNLTLEKEQFPNDTILSIKENEKNTEVLINNKNKTLKILSYKDLEYSHLETLKQLINIVNNKNY